MTKATTPMRHRRASNTDKVHPIKATTVELLRRLDSTAKAHPRVSNGDSPLPGKAARVKLHSIPHRVHRLVRQVGRLNGTRIRNAGITPSTPVAAPNGSRRMPRLWADTAVLAMVARLTTMALAAMMPLADLVVVVATRPTVKRRAMVPMLPMVRCRMVLIQRMSRRRRRVAVMRCCMVPVVWQPVSSAVLSSPMRLVGHPQDL